MMCLSLVGCSDDNNTLDRVLILRDNILNANECTFTVEITADYEDSVYSFVMDCAFNSNGDLVFEVIEPSTISGITGRFGETYNDLMFDNHILAFSRLADGEVTPVSAPWVLMKALRCGYIREYSADEDETQVIINDTYEDEALELFIWIDELSIPIFAEIYWQGTRVLTLGIKDFSVV